MGTQRILSAIGLLLATSLASVTTSAQSYQLVQAPLVPLRGHPVHDLVVGDLHGDGRTFIVGMLLPPDADRAPRIVIEEHVGEQGHPQFGSFNPYETLPADLPTAVALTDLDGDGDLDLLVAQDRGDDALAIWINQGEPEDGVHRAVFQRSPARYAYDLVGDLLTIPRPDGGPPDLLLVRAMGRPAVLLRSGNGMSATTYGERQVLTAPDAAFIGALVTDLDGDARPDILLYGNGCWVWLQRGPLDGDHHFEPSQSALGSCPFVASGSLIAAAATPLPTQPGGPSGRTLLALAGIDGRDHQVLLEWSPASILHQELPQLGAGQTRAMGFLDVDQDGQTDLLAVRSGPDGSAVLRRDGEGFNGTLGRFARGWGMAVAPLQSAQPAMAWIAGWLDPTSSWQPGSDTGAIPSLNFGGPALQNLPMGYFEAGRIGETLHIAPFARDAVVVDIVATRPDGLVSSGNRVLQAGISEATSSQSAAVSPGEWRMDIVASWPPGSTLPGQPQTATSIMMPSRDPLLCPFCVAICVTVGDCRCAAIEGDSTTQPLAGQFMGTLDDVQQLRRLRDERLAVTTGGQHYVETYLSLQQDLYEAIFSDPQMYHDLWELKDAWMPALSNLLDGDGQMLIDAAMQSSLRRSLGRLAALGSSALRETVERERIALQLDSLQGRPVFTLQQRWELSRLFAHGFETAH